MHSLLRVSFTCAYVELRSSDLDFVGGRGRGGGLQHWRPSAAHPNDSTPFSAVTSKPEQAFPS